MTSAPDAPGPDTLPRRLWRLAVSTVTDAADDRAPGLAAEVAFFTILSLPPLLLTLFGLAGFVSDLVGTSGTETMREWVLDVSDEFLSAETIREAVVPTLDAVLEGGRADIALLGILLALWSGSRATTVTMRAITIAYDVEPRPAWRRRALALAITVVATLAGLTLVPVLVLGPGFAGVVGLHGAWDAAWRVVYWPAVGLAVTALLATLYHVSVPWWTPWRRDFPGAALAVVLWLASAGALRVYTSWAVGSDTTYGPLATPVVVLLWLYVTALAVIMGAELNGEIAKHWPDPEHDRARAAALEQAAAGGDEA